MKLAEVLRKPAPPWIISVGSDADGELFALDAHTRNFVLDGADMRTRSGFYMHLTEVFHFPDYQGHNLNALEESLNDLDVEEYSSIVVILKNAQLLLCEESSESKKAFWELL